jgi:hypothetical protein
MNIAQILEIVAILTGVVGLLRGVRNASKAWDGILQSIKDLNEKVGKLVELNEAEHQKFRTHIKRHKGNDNAL